MCFLVSNSQIGPNVSIGSRAIIGKGCRIRDSIILDNVEIKNFSYVYQAVIGWGSKIGKWSRLEGVPVPENDVEQNTNILYTTILGRGVSVTDEVIIRSCVVLPHKELKTSYKNQILM